MALAVRSVSRLAADIAAGRFVVSGEVAPPKTSRVGPFFARSEAMARFSRAITVTNNHGGEARLSSLIASSFLVRRGIEPIWVCLARDQNRLSLESDFIGAEVMDIRNVLCLHGDVLPVGKTVHDIGVLGLIKMAVRRRDAGQALFVGAAIDLTSNSAEKAAEMAARRVDAGVDFLITQPVYDVTRVEAYLEEAEKRLSRPVALLIGMMPLLSKEAVRRVPERLRIVIDDHILRRIGESDDPKREGLAVTTETLKALRRLPGVSGVNFMPFGFKPEFAEDVRVMLRDLVAPTAV